MDEELNKQESGSCDSFHGSSGGLIVEDHHVLSNLLESLEAQDGSSGPVQNLITSLQH